MKKLISIGEALIDFIPSVKNCALKDVPSFERKCGGAPANVAAAVAKLGGKAYVITQLGKDAFGDYIVDVLNAVNVRTDYILRTNKANTALAFVSLKRDGSRDFSFYHNGAADTLLDKNDLSKDWFTDCGILHFGSVDLIEAPVKYAHKRSIEMAKENGAFISFDPNIRLPLWNDASECKSTVREFMKYADIVKISDEEIEFIFDTDSIEEASKLMFDNGVKIIVYSLGKNGAMLLTPHYKVVAKNCNVNVVDTTGAGDSITGAFLYSILHNDIENIEEIDKDDMQKYLNFANYYSNFSVQRGGAIPSYANLDEINDFIMQHKNDSM